MRTNNQSIIFVDKAFRKELCDTTLEYLEGKEKKIGLALALMFYLMCAETKFHCVLRKLFFPSVCLDVYLFIQSFIYLS